MGIALLLLVCTWASCCLARAAGALLAFGCQRLVSKLDVHSINDQFRSTAGSKTISDVSVRAARPPDSPYTWNLAYNLIGPGRWDVVVCSAMMPGGGGLAKPKNLLPQEHPNSGVASGSPMDCSVKPPEAAGEAATPKTNAASGGKA